MNCAKSHKTEDTHVTVTAAVFFTAAALGSAALSWTTEIWKIKNILLTLQLRKYHLLIIAATLQQQNNNTNNNHDHNKGSREAKLWP